MLPPGVRGERLGGTHAGPAHGQEVDARQELLGLGAANLAVALRGGYPVAGGLSQSAVNDKAGARTPLALVFASGTLALCLLFLTGLVATLPQAVLAAIVLVAVTGLIDIAELASLEGESLRVWGVDAGAPRRAAPRHPQRRHRGGVSLVLLSARRSPARRLPGRIPGTDGYSDLEVNPDNEPIPGVLVVRVESALLYFNVEHVRDGDLGGGRAAPTPVRLVVCDLSTSAIVDLAGARILATLHSELKSAGIRLRLVDARASVRDILRAEGLEKRVGNFGRGTSVGAAIDEFRQETDPGGRVA